MQSVLRNMLVGAVFLTAPLTAQAQDTLADVQQDLAVLSVELQKLKRELSTTGASDVTVSGDVLQRVNLIESELARVTAKTEELEHRVVTVAEDGANRLGDLQFRVCEMEPGCDLATIGQTTTLGGESGVPAAPSAPVAGSGTDSLPFEGELAVSEEEDFRSAKDALDEGDFQRAADLFANFRESYPMGPLEPAALVGEGRALEGMGDTREAARRYLDAYSGFPDSQSAPEALWRLGTKLGELGSVQEACVTLAEVPQRYGDSDYVDRAAESRDTFSCQ
ncbi:tol-pal system protein YbgF [Sagittula marina]|uniref:Cell division coordinator CpoB n=1 Tax=Sagittula marina TaxID=943940 RepID=A0A7W6GRN8_9RHOB|nr:tetratricopeptide repeat protein [Sagittula marina]MBB3984917.1 tol-pal system protein YbgF [Sagittula marina]